MGFREGSQYFLLLFIFCPAGWSAPQSLINVHEVEPALEVDLAYNTRQNFLQRPVLNYRANNCYLLPAAAAAVARVNASLAEQGVRLSLRDCWRPFSASADMVRWAHTNPPKIQTDLSESELEIFSDPRLFANGLLIPAKLLRLNYLTLYSNHNRGSTIDTEVEKLVGSEWSKLNLGTNFDVFSPKAHQNTDLGVEVNANRALLFSAMHNAGFSGLSTEWWHWTHSASNSGPYLDGLVN